MASVESKTDFVGLKGFQQFDTPSRDIVKAEHFVQFYEDDRALVPAVSAFIGGGLAAGESAIMICTPEHRSAIERAMLAQGIDLTGAASSERYFVLDAAETLSQFMVDGRLDAARFLRVAGDVMAKAARAGTGLRAFGEMVALLWAEGRQQAALRLEELWNELGREYRFSLFCAYPRSYFLGHAAGVPWLHVCKAHSRVIV